MSTQTDRKVDLNKPAWSRMPWEQLNTVMSAMMHGDAKYSPMSWQRIDDAEDALYSAAIRHLVAWKEGERLDPDSGLPHLAHAVSGLLYLMWHDGKTRRRSDTLQAKLKAVIEEWRHGHGVMPTDGAAFELVKAWEAAHAP